jgi:hypothetical protein
VFVKNTTIDSNSIFANRYWRAIWAMMNCLGGIILVCALANNYFGAAAIGFAGAFIMFRGKFFNDISWVSGTAAKVFGLIWLVVGIVIGLINTF